MLGDPNFGNGRTENMPGVGELEPDIAMRLSHLAILDMAHVSLVFA